MGFYACFYYLYTKKEKNFIDRLFKQGFSADTYGRYLGTFIVITAITVGITLLITAISAAIGVGAGVVSFSNKSSIEPSAIIGLLVFAMTPAFIVSYIIGLFFAFVPFVLLDHPKMGIIDSIKYGIKLIDGYKLELFYLHVYFLGWFFLVVFTLGIASLWALPYFYTAQSVFYCKVKEEKEALKTDTATNI